MPAHLTFEPRTEALRRALTMCGVSSADDLRFLEAWEADPIPGAGAALRVGQIRRANPTLAAEIRAELASAARGRMRRQDGDASVITTP